MLKQKILLSIPLTIIGGLLVHTWIVLLFGNSIAVWQQYLALLAFIPLAFAFFSDFGLSLLGTVVYLLAATFNLITLTPEVASSSYPIGFGNLELWTLKINPLSTCLLVAFLILNFGALVELWVDFQRWKFHRKDHFEDTD